MYALSATVTLAGSPVLDLGWLYQPVIGLVTPFRASGRFIWALHYLTLLFGVWGATRILGPSRLAAGTALLALAVALQAADLEVDSSWAATKKFRQAPAAELALATGRYTHMALYPMQVLGVCGDPYEEEHVYRFMMLAYRLQMTFNSGIYARVQADRIGAECARLDRKVNAGELDPKTLYVVTPAAVPLFRDARASCGRFDGDWLCVAKDSDKSFRRLLDTGKPPA